MDRVDQELRKEEEAACVCVWVTTSDPDSIAVEGTLKLEEPVGFTEEQHNEFFTRLGNMELPEVHPGAARMMDYEVLLHVDQVLDFTPLSDSPSWKSYESETSGIPDESLDDEWPVKHRFSWQLGVPDRGRSPPRVPVHERLGAGRRDRSPDRGAGGRDQMQLPPPPHTAFRADGAGSSGHGGRPGGRTGGFGSAAADGHYRGHAAKEGDFGPTVMAGAGGDDSNTAGEDGATVLWRKQHAVKPVDVQAELAFLFCERADNDACQWDPMLQEAFGTLLGAHEKNANAGLKGVQEFEQDMCAALGAGRGQQLLESSARTDPMGVELLGQTCVLSVVNEGVFECPEELSSVVLAEQGMPGQL